MQRPGPDCAPIATDREHCPPFAWQATSSPHVDATGEPVPSHASTASKSPTATGVAPRRQDQPTLRAFGIDRSSPIARLSAGRFAASDSVPLPAAFGGFTLFLCWKGQVQLVLLPPVAHESRRVLATPINPFRGPFGPSPPEADTTPAADFCRPVRMDRSTLSLVSQTNGRSPEVSSTAFDAQPSDLQPVPLMDMDFAVASPLVRHCLPLIRFLSIGSRLCSMLLSDPASRRHPCTSLSLHLHQVVKGTCILKLSNMLGTLAPQSGKA